MKSQSRPLTVREIRFCQFWADHGNAFRAFRDAGLEAATDEAARKAACKLLTKGNIRTYIEELKKNACEAAQVTIDDLAADFRRAAKLDLTAILDDDGAVLPKSQWPEDIRRAIVRIEVEELSEWQPDPDSPGNRKKVAIGTKWRIWTENKTRCREILAKWKRMTSDDETLLAMDAEIKRMREQLEKMNAAKDGSTAQGESTEPNT